MENAEGLERELYRVGIGLFVLAAAAVPLMFFFLSGEHLTGGFCVFRVFLGMYCPGCGGTRAVDALIHGHLLKSLWYHPLVPYCVILYLSFMVSWTAAKFQIFDIKRGMRFRAGYLYGMLGIIVLNFLIKNLLKFCFGIVMI